MMHMNNRLREEDSKHIIWPLLEVNHLIFDVRETEEASSYWISVLYHAFYIQYVRKSTR